MSYIELLDHNEESELLMEEIFRVVKDRIEDPIYDQEVSDIVYDMYYRLCREQNLCESPRWWQQNFWMYKIIREEIENRNIETSLTDIERQSNLHLIDSILFYIKLMILQLNLRN